MVYPKLWKHRAKYVFWYFYTPYHPVVRDTALRLRFVRHEERQPYLLGHIAPHLSLEDFIMRLISLGFANHFVAWQDKDEIASLRLVHDFVYQYHIRVFSDGEVRAHYEYTPECYPLSHLKRIDMEPRREEFLRMLGDAVIPMQ